MFPYHSKREKKAIKHIQGHLIFSRDRACCMAKRIKSTPLETLTLPSLLICQKQNGSRHLDSQLCSLVNRVV